MSERSTPPGPIRTAAPPGLALRPVTDDDLPFLAELYASTRREEVARTPWSEEQREAFLAWQFEAQHRHYLEHYPEAERLVVERPEPGGGGTAVGRLYVARWDDQIRIVDIALVPAARGQGWGTALLGEVLAEGEARNLPVTIHVEHENPALTLYRRLGFRQIDTNGVYLLMERRPGGADDG